MTRVGVYEAKTHFARLIERVRKGERITITKHGVPVAMLSPLAAAPESSVAATIDAIRRFRRGRRLRPLGIRRLIAEGRR